MLAFTFETTPRIVCEQGAAARLGPLLAELAATHVFVVTDKGLEAAGVLEPALASIRAAGLRATVFTDVLADPPQASVEQAVASAVRAGCDAVVGLGGGSSMDTAKLVALLARSPAPLDDLYGIDRARGTRLPLVQVPTTAGTGSEVTPIAIVTTPSSEKKGVVSRLLYPDIAVLDAQLTFGLPARVTAMTGVDAMVHAIEAFTSRHRKNPVSDALATQALALMYPNLPRAVADGRDGAAREAMLLGSLLAGMAFANSPVAAVHALAYPIGGHFHVPHGLSNALVLAPVLRFNAAHAQAHYAQLGRTLGVCDAGAAEARQAQSFVDAMARLVAQMPFEQRLRDVGIAANDVPMLAQDAIKVERLLVNNPREVTLADAHALYEEAL
jgi:alcohol dehydrogenase class IV